MCGLLRVLIVLVLLSIGDLGVVLAAESPPMVGRKAASKYFRPRAEDQESRSIANEPVGERYLALHIGSYLETEAFYWSGSQKLNDVGRLTMGVTYLLGEWISGVDLHFRADLNSYELNEHKALKLTFMPVLIFPDAKSHFPLYFGAGVGPGIFFRQVGDESPIALDLQLFAGWRFLNLAENIGFFIETGLKNHVHLLSDGQLNGVYLALGSVFTF